MADEQNQTPLGHEELLGVTLDRQNNLVYLKFGNDYVTVSCSPPTKISKEKNPFEARPVGDPSKIKTTLDTRNKADRKGK